MVIAKFLLASPYEPVTTSQHEYLSRIMTLLFGSGTTHLAVRRPE
jgi:hypothetical protein